MKIHNCEVDVFGPENLKSWALVEDGPDTHLTIYLSGATIRIPVEGHANRIRVAKEFGLPL